MSIVGNPQAQLQEFYRSAPLPCPYLPGRIERKLFTRLRGPNAAAANSAFTQAGFRRSHDIVYRPVCQGCDACVPVRIPTAAFRRTRSIRRIFNKNSDVTMSPGAALAWPAHYALFARYQASRHSESDMARMRFADYQAMIEDGATDTTLQLFHDGAGELIGAALVDWVSDGASMIYSFFEPELAHRSLGQYMIYALVEHVAALGQPHVYLGYWVEGSPKMAYKARLGPIEALGQRDWYRLDQVRG